MKTAILGFIVLSLSSVVGCGGDVEVKAPDAEEHHEEKAAERAADRAQDNADDAQRAADEAKDEAH
jgi:hypothetical protein